eukprot:757736-Hanusia_phi.AAC.8
MAAGLRGPAGTVGPGSVAVSIVPELPVTCPYTSGFGETEKNNLKMSRGGAAAGAARRTGLLISNRTVRWTRLRSRGGRAGLPRAPEEKWEGR